MKKSILCIMSSILLIAGCQPINPPQSEEEVVRIITILYNGLGKPAKVCLEPLAELGFNVPYYLPDSRTGYDEGYYVKTDNYEISIACNHDSVSLARYGYRFRSTYVEGVKEFHKADDAVFHLGWEQWKGGYNSKYHDLSLHDEASINMDSCVAEHKGAQLLIFSSYQKAFFEKYLFARVHYWGVSVGGMDPDTGEGRESMADGDVYIEFTVYDTPHNF